MTCPCGRETGDCHNNTATQTCHCQLCSGLNQEACEICGLQVPSVCLANDEILVGEEIQSDTCECFFSTFTSIAPEENNSYTRDTGFPAEITRDNSKPLELSHSEENGRSHLLVEKNVKNGTESTSTPELSNSSDGYVLSPDDHSDRISDRDPDFESEHSEDCSNNNLHAKKMSNIKDLYDVTKTDQENRSEFSEHSTGEDTLSSQQMVRSRESSNNSGSIEKSKKKQRKTTASIGTDPYRIEIRSIRPSLPHPFPQFNRPVLPSPVIPTNVPGRFTLLPRIRMNTSPNQKTRNIEGKSGLSKKQLTESLDSEMNPIDRSEKVESWLSEVGSDPPDEIPAEETDEEQQGSECGPDLFEVSTDNRSSTEISEEENRRQRLQRHPPRKTSLTRRKSKK